MGAAPPDAARLRTGTGLHDNASVHSLDQCTLAVPELACAEGMPRSHAT